MYDASLIFYLGLSRGDFPGCVRGAEPWSSCSQTRWATRLQTTIGTGAIGASGTSPDDRQGTCWRALGNEGGSGGTSVGRRPARLLDANRGFDARLSRGGSYEGQCRCAFLLYRQENISEGTPRLLRRTVLCRLCNESGGLEVRGPHAHEPAYSVMCIVGT